MQEFIQSEIDKLEKRKMSALADFHQAVGALAAYRNILTGMEKIDAEEKAQADAKAVPAQKEVINQMMGTLNPGIGQQYHSLHDEAVPVS